jgi:hypothetical protein
MGRLSRLSLAAVSVGAVFIISNVDAFAYRSGSVGYDISYLQCSSYSPGISATSRPATLGSSGVTRPGALAGAIVSTGPWRSVARQTSPFPVSRPWFRSVPPSFGIVGVDSGYPFMSPAHPGNPCLSREYAATPQPGLYINTGYDPSYTDSNHTTIDCKNQSAAVVGSPDQQAAWAVGCSEAQGDYGYVTSQGIGSPVAWWLDVETANSWCGQAGTSCTDKSLNQFTIQGIIDTLTHIGAVPIGVYSNSSQWSAIVGTLPITGATMDWVASGTSTAQQAATYCNSSQSFSGAPVSLVQFVASGSIDRDYAC